MNPLSKILLFFSVCIIAGLGIGSAVSWATLHNQQEAVNARNRLAAISQNETASPVGNVSSNTTNVVSDDLLQNGTEPVVATATIAPTTASSITTASPTIPKKPPFTCPSAPKGEVDQWLAPVGPTFSVGNDYIPYNLVPLANYVITSSSTVCINQEVAEHLQAMETIMKMQGLHIVVSSGYRPASYQEGLRDASEAKRNPITNPYPLVALPGHSEHQLGMAMDLVAGPNYTLDDFINTPEYAWLIAHSWQFGFIQSYPIGSEPTTGYSTESWHFRYVGDEHAINIHNQHITTYQYLQTLKVLADAKKKTAA